MAETSKSFWGKFKKSKLDTPIEDKIPSRLLEIFGSSIDSMLLYSVYALHCNRSIADTIAYLTREGEAQPCDGDDEVPIEVIIESLRCNELLNNNNSTTLSHIRRNYFAATPTHVLRHIFSFNDVSVWGTLTCVNRECRLLAKAMLSAITAYDFSFYYHRYYCQHRGGSTPRNRSLRMVSDDGLRLASHVNAFPYLLSLSLRSTAFSKWYIFDSILNKSKITHLNLSSSLNLCDDDIGTMMEAFPALQSLDLSNCIDITDLGMTNIIEHERCDELHSIYLNHTPRITKNGIKQLLTYKKNITRLEWKGSKYGNLSALFGDAKHLTYLNLSSNPQLQQLALRWENSKTTHGLELNLSNCTKLTSLDLKITHLESLGMAQCVRLREVRVDSVHRFKHIQCKSCKSLQLLAIHSDCMESINLSGCNALRLDALFWDQNFMLQSLRRGRLASLDMSQMHHVTDAHIALILQCNDDHAAPLKAFSVSECKSISQSQIASVCALFEKPTLISTRTQKRKKRGSEWRNRKYNS